MISALRFFMVSPLHSRYMWLAMVAVFVSGAAMLIVEPAKGANVLGPLALLQMFAASSGFAVGARRGHLDLLLTAGPGRPVVAVTHLGLSVLPGLVVWCALGVVEMLAAGTVSPSAFAAGSMVALCSVSALAWAASVRLPRLSGGIAWLLGIAVWVVGWSGGPTMMAVLDDRTGFVTRALVITVCPFVLLGKPLSRGDLPVVLPVTLLALALTAGAIAWIVRMDVPLESAQ